MSGSEYAGGLHALGALHRTYLPIPCGSSTRHPRSMDMDFVKVIKVVFYFT